MMISRIISLRPIAAALLAATILVFFINIGLAKEEDLFVELRGKWGGGGIMSLTENRRARLICDALYTGTESQLRLAINCSSEFQDIHLQARLSSNNGRLLGTWEEKTYKAIGTIAGAATKNRITFYIGGNVLGNMTVVYSRRKQSVLIEAVGIPMQKLEINLTRR